MTKPSNYFFEGGRLKAPVAESVKAFTQQNLSQGWMQDELTFGVEIDKAHVVMLAESGILKQEVAGALLKTLLEMQALGASQFPININLGGTYAQIEGYLNEKLGPRVGGQLHIGRSRIDRRATMSRLISRDLLMRVISQVLILQKALLEVSAQHTETVMPGYTHMQHAQPMTFGHYLSSYFERLQRDVQRLLDALPRLNRCPLGTAALAGTSWPLDRTRTAMLLGFDGEIRSAKDAGEFYKDYNLEIISALAILMTTLSHLANELYLWHAYEFDFVELSDGYAATSSMMPQKKNPHALDIIKSLSSYVIGLPAVEFSLHHMSTSTDLDATLSQSSVRIGADKTLMALDIFSGVIATLKVNQAKMREQATRHWATTIHLADCLTREIGISFRESHKICGRFVRLALSQGISPEEATGALLDQAAQEVLGQALNLEDAFVREALDVDQFMCTRITSGSTAPQEVSRIIMLQREDWMSTTGQVEQLTANFSQANQQLTQAVLACC